MTNSFITNAAERSLKDRLHALIQHSEELKFLVGFFYFSGWQELYEALKINDQLTIKVLVGLNTDHHLGQVWELADPQASTSSREEITGRFISSLRTALRDEKLDDKSFYEQVTFFLKLLENGRLQIRKTLEPNHAKLYLFGLGEAGQSISGTPGRFITGSSNLTRSGLLSQQEFNVEIGDYGWDEAEGYFDNLWDLSIPLSENERDKERILHLVRRQTQAAEITPFEAYALVLKTYLDLMEQKALRPQVKQLMKERGYKIYRYQEEAVQQALTVLEEYGGVILADVVGLGKSIIACWLARERGGRGLVICPPALIGDAQSTGWEKYLSDFKLYDWKAYSLGKLEEVQEYLELYGDDVNTIIVDEAHRFRNEDTENYERLSQICANRGVILLSATPFNNAPADIFALLKLFIPPGKSTLTIDEKLAARFARYNSKFRKLSYILRYHRGGGSKQKQAERYYEEIFEEHPPIDVVRVRQRVRRLADEIRAVMEPVVIRRNRLDLKQDPLYAEELTELSEAADPAELFYELTPEQAAFYNQVINEYFGEEGQFRGAIYQPYAYEQTYEEGKQLKEEDQFSYLQQRNLYEFMRRLLVKRFESSFGAFARSVKNFIHVHNVILSFIEKTGRYILDRTLIEKIWEEDEEFIEEALRQFAERLAEEKEELDPRHDRIYKIDEFDNPEKFLDDIHHDLELLQHLDGEIERLSLVAHDPKREGLAKEVKSILETPPDNGEPPRKVIIFSEYTDTVNHIAPVLQRAFPERVMVVKGAISKTFLGRLHANFDASHRQDKQLDDFDILVTTDKLSEGVNLNRAGAVINYDIPWNPTRVIQRLGRINRIGHKVFGTLYIYNFFPTEQGAEIVKSREIAAQKMFLIHHTLGEDSKIFAPDETPSPADLFKRINRNPEEEEEESLLTALRKEFFDIQERYPEMVEGLADFSPRIKTAKEYTSQELLVFRRKALQLFIHAILDTADEKLEITPLLLEEALPHIRCEPGTERETLSVYFWPAYEEIKAYREQTPMPASERSLQVRAESNLRSARQRDEAALQKHFDFIETLLRDLKYYQTLPKYTLRRLTNIEMTGEVSPAGIERFCAEIEALRRALGDNYLERIDQRIKEKQSEIIIAVENIDN